MAYPANPPVLTNQQSIDVIIESEASILQGLNDLYCNDFVVDILASGDTPENQLTAMSNILNIMACKECTIAKILSAASKVLVVDKGIIDQGGTNGGFDCSYCQ
ncbi:hypothetical protein [Clostridium sp. B9]|uniref:hypothetical protein n=1 Tax=Clostridium sp. B9 TaxID=3423224 RepID=UPI003D2F24A0